MVIKLTDCFVASLLAMTNSSSHCNCYLQSNNGMTKNIKTFRPLKLLIIFTTNNKFNNVVPVPSFWDTGISKYKYNSDSGIDLTSIKPE